MHFAADLVACDREQADRGDFRAGDRIGFGMTKYVDHEVGDFTRTCGRRLGAFARGHGVAPLQFGEHGGGDDAGERERAEAE